MDRRRMSWQILGQYLLTLLAFFVLFFGGYLAAWWICLQFTWYPEDNLYVLLKVLQYSFPIWGFALALGVTVLITYYFISKPLRYLDEVIKAAEQLSHLSEEPIVLSDGIRGVQDQLNLVREQALRSAQAAREAEQRKNDLIVYLAHDLKTPLTSVIGYMTLLRDEPQISPELKARYTQIALDKSERLEELINEFFDITRFNLTQLSLEFERVNLSRMLEQIIFEFQPILEEKKLAITLHAEPRVDVLCDPDKLERVFDNLFRNAISYSYPSTEIAVNITQSQNEIMITVKNHGKTIPEEKLTRIFEQFFRLDASRGSATGGAGLGLAIAKEIVELHRGTITASSADESITFTIVLPSACQKNV